MNPNAILALISELYTKNVELSVELEKVQLERDTYKVMLDSLDPNPDFSPE